MMSAPAPAMPMPPGGAMEIVFTFDTTGSMSSCLIEVRTKLQEIITRLFKDIPALRIAVFAHGDYCDGPRTYITKHVDFTNDVNQLCKFVQGVGPTGGGDWEECYELVLREARTDLSWTPGSQRSIVMIGDAIPHPPTDKQNKQKIDWKQEVKDIRDQLRAKIYAVQASANESADHFYEHMANETCGKHLRLEQFENIVEMMMAICYREQGAEYFEAYENEVRSREGAGIRAELDHMLHTLRDGDAAGASSSSVAAPVPIVGVRKYKKIAAARLTGATSDGDSEDASSSTRSLGVRGGGIRKGKKSAVARKALKAAVVESDDLVKYRLGKQFRETIGAAEFNKEFSNMKWSDWYEAMLPEEPEESDGWLPRPAEAGTVGVRNTNLFWGSTNLPAVYELGVQVRDGGQRYPVMCRSTKGFSRGCWDSHMFKRSSGIYGQMTRALQKGCKLVVRRSLVANKQKKRPRGGAASVHELGRLLNSQYDYAWSVGRKISKGGVEV